MKNIQKHKGIFLLGIILLLAAFLRLYRIGDYMTFLGDEGRDVLVVRHILQGQFTLLGPRASAGDFFTGPIYYYMMAPFLWLFHYDPVGPAVMIALLGIATVGLIYFITKKFFDEKAALFASGLYAVSPLVISYSRSSWNPNPMPFFTLLILYLLYKGLTKNSWKVLLITGVLYGITLQLHYIELFVGVIIFLYLLFGNWLLEKKGMLLRVIKQYAVLLGGFIIGFSPFLAFEIRHGFANTKTIMTFVLHGSAGATDTTHLSFFQIISDVFFRLFGRLLMRYPDQFLMHNYQSYQLQLWQITVFVLAFVSLIYLVRVKNNLVKLLLALWLIFGVVLFGLYKKPIYDYYFEFMFPLPFILLGNALSRLTEEQRLKKIGLVVGCLIFLGLFVFNLMDNPFRFQPNKQKQQMETIATFVLSKTGKKPFNFALLTHGNSDHAYRYFMEVEGDSPVTIENAVVDPQRKTVTDQLLIVCEYKDCQPLGNPLFEVAGFGRADIAGIWDVSVVKVYRLVHYHGK